MRGETTATFAFATIFGVGALALVGVAFGTNYWVETNVNRAEIIKDTVTTDNYDNNPAFFTRYRGVFRTCYPGTDTKFLEGNQYLVDGSCLSEQGYAIPDRDPATLSYGEDYTIRIHLMRAHFASFVLALFFIVVCCLMGVVGCWKASSRVVRSTGVLMFLGMFFVAAAMALFHGFYYLEVNTLKLLPGTEAYINEQAAKNNAEYITLRDNDAPMYSYSYIVGWVGLGIGAISGILYLVVAYQLSVDELQHKMGSDKKIRSRAYDYMDQHQQPYSPDEYGGKYPYQGAGTYPGAQQGYNYAYPDVGYADNVAYDYGGGYRY